MASDHEPAKLLLPYLQRADELQKHEPLSAYYCRLYAMERGMKIPQSQRTKTTNSILISLMNQLEKDKKSLKLGPDDYLHMEGFALNVFAKADKQDRAGRADLNTAKTFYAASIFFEILNQFGELQPDLEQKQKYAAWKAADIRKAVKEGRKPEAGGPVDDTDISISSNTLSSSNDLGPSRTDSTVNLRPESDTLSPHFDPKILNRQSSNISQSLHFNDELNNRQSTNMPPSNSSYSAPNYSPQDFSQSEHFDRNNYSHDFPSPPSKKLENSTYYQPYQHHQPYTQEPQEPKNYFPTSDPQNFQNFQSYPSFTETSLPIPPTRYPSFNQSSEANYSSAVEHKLNNINGAALVPNFGQTLGQTYEYDCNYQPPPDKVAEAHKAARFAVGALAFDDVSVAVDFLRKSLELLTNPLAG